jgi:hypothetical protein
VKILVVKSDRDEQTRIGTSEIVARNIQMMHLQNVSRQRKMGQEIGNHLLVEKLP